MTCPFCGRDAAPTLEGSDTGMCRDCADRVDVGGALKLLPPEPTAIGRYEILRVVGRGMSGTVYEAKDPVLGRRLALKVLAPLSHGEEALQRFLREARLLAKIGHPNVVSIHELGEAEGKRYLAMEFVEGVPFPGTGTRDQALARLAAAARAVEAVHGKGIVHRDLKPSNVLVEAGGRPVLMDFGIAREEGGTSAATASGVLLGTLGYLAPEQLDRGMKAATVRSDVYALGVMLYEVLAGRLPYEGATIEEYAASLKRGAPMRPPGPPALAGLCLRSLSRDPVQRPASAGAFAAELEAARSAKPRRMGRRWILSGAALLFLVLGVGAALRRKPSPPPLPVEELKARGSRLVTERMALLFDRKAYPELVKALEARLVRDEVPSWEAELGRQAAGSEGARLAGLYRAVAAGEWAAAKAGVGEKVLGLALTALGEGVKPGALLAARPWEEAIGEEEAVWMGVLLFLDRRAPRPRMGAGGGREPRSHPVLKRVEAAVREGAGEKDRARELLAAAVAARPDYLTARLEWARLLAESGDDAEAARERAEVDRRKLALGLPR